MITATGRLVEIEINAKGYRTAHLLDGRFLQSFQVSSAVNGALDAAMGENVTLIIRQGRTKWIDALDGKRYPAESYYCAGVLAPADDALAAAA